MLRWGICSAGKISNDFTIALNCLGDKNKIIAVAARDIKRAEEFSQKHSIPKSYGSYKELAQDPDIDIVYIGGIHTVHYDTSVLMLENGKHVLCEKPMCLNVKQTESLQKIAKSKNLFLMEAIWSRTFPVYKKLKEMINDGVIGEVRYVWASFSDYVKSPVPRVTDKDKAGGTLMDLGVYPIQFAQFVYNDEKPIKQFTAGSLLETGVDAEAHTVLQYSNNRTAVLATSLRSVIPNDAIASGTKGYIKVHDSMWSPERLTLYLKNQEPQEFVFKLPQAKGQIVFPYGQGLQYEVEAVEKWVRQGLKESPIVSHKATLNIAEILEKARHQLGYRLPQDDE